MRNLIHSLPQVIDAATEQPMRSIPKPRDPRAVARRKAQKDRTVQVAVARAMKGANR